MNWLFAAGAALVIVAWTAYRRRLASMRGGALTDDMIRHLEEGGNVSVEEPLDLDEAAAEEERFWSESWDEPESW